MKKVSVNQQNVSFKPMTVDMEKMIAEALIKTYQAEVDPEYLKQLASLVNKQLEAHKDTEDYNLNLVSEVIDKTIQVFMEGGQKDFSPGDAIKIQEKVMTVVGKKNYLEDLNQAIAEGNYEMFPFSHSVEAEIRAVHILQTNKKDKFKDLYSQFKALAGDFMSAQEVQVLDEAITKAFSRISKNLLFFPAPPEGMNQGVLRPLTEQELKEYNLSAQMMVDERYDNHDMMALKDLVLLMEGKSINALSMGPSFFAKYLPELKTLGYNGVVCEVKGAKLTKIQLVKIPSDSIDYSPVDAATTLVFAQQLKVELMGEKETNGSFEFSIKKVNKDFFTNDSAFFVIVDGCVAVPKSKVPYDYELSSNNNLRLAAGEVFFFEKKDSQVVQTRIGFVPYQYNMLHLLHQHGSMVYGSNDQAFQSCYKNPKDMAESSVNDYKLWWKNKVDKSPASFGDAFSPAVIAAKIHYFLKKPDGTVSDSSDIFKTENREALELAMHSISEQTEFTKEWTIDTLHYYNIGYSLDIRKFITALCEVEAPLNRRWLIKQYLEDGTGITVEKQPTFYIRLAQKLEEDKQGANIALLFKLKEVENKVKSGATQEAALEQVFSRQVVAEIKKLDN